MQNNKKAGFTLVELAIVLVIIGLVVGGVLVGKDLIEAAEIRAAANETQAFRTGYIVFKDKYKCVPGDCRRASKFLEDADNGDSLISCSDPVPSCYSTAPEQELVFDHLSRTGLIKSGKYANNEAMSARIGSCQFFAFEHRQGDNQLYGAKVNNYLFLNMNLMDAPWTDNCLTPAQAAGIDSKLDDGYAGTGRLYGYAKNSGDNSECANKPNDVGTQPRAEYYVQKDDIGCAVAMQLD